jgi:hypothetical protein
MPPDPSRVQRWKAEVMRCVQKYSSFVHRTTINAIPQALLLMIGCWNFLMSGTYPKYSYVEMTNFCQRLHRIAAPTIDRMNQQHFIFINNAVLCAWSCISSPPASPVYWIPPLLLLQFTQILLLVVPHTKLITAPSPHTPNTLLHRHGNKNGKRNSWLLCILSVFQPHFWIENLTHPLSFCSPQPQNTSHLMPPIDYGTYMLFSTGGRGKNAGWSDREVGFGKGTWDEQICCGGYGSKQ